MARLNSVMLIGLVTDDAVVHQSPDGDPDGVVCVFRVDVTQPPAAGKPQTCTVTVEARRGLGSVCAKHVRSGREVFVAGRLRPSRAGGESQDRDGLTVDARTIQFLKSARD
jgi:single-stranded DNA-binding protein